MSLDVIYVHESPLVTLTSGPPAFLFFCTMTHLVSDSFVTVHVTSRPSVVCKEERIFYKSNHLA